MSANILMVDDDPNVLAAARRGQRKEFSMDTALGGAEGLAMISKNEAYAVIVADMQMPEMNGIQFLTRARDKSPDSVRIMLTGNADQRTAQEAVNQGHVFRFLNKPCSTDELSLALNAGLQQYRLVVAERELLERTLNGSVKMLTDILAVLDPGSFGQGQRLRDYMRTHVQFVNLAQAWELELAAMLSPIGFVTVPPAVLEKARAGRGLTEPERSMLTRVPEIGFNLLANIPRLESAARIILYQNKNFDGSGFPSDQVRGEDIPLGARILRVLKFILAMDVKGVPKFRAFEKMAEAPGWYDPKVLQAVAASFDVSLALDCSPDCSPADSPADSPEASGRSITFKELRIGQVLKADLQTAEGALIVPAGTEISQMLMHKLHNFAELRDIQEPICVVN